MHDEDTCMECGWSEVVITECTEEWVCTHPDSFGQITSRDFDNDPPMRCRNYTRFV
jgi:hypothetical protein